MPQEKPAFASITTFLTVLEASEERFTQSVIEAEQRYEQLVAPQVAELLQSCVKNGMRALVVIQTSDTTLNSTRAFTLEGMHPSMVTAMGVVRPVEHLDQAIPAFVKICQDHGKIMVLAQALIES